MGLVVVTLVLAVALGWALGGRLSRLDRVPYDGLPLLAAASVAYCVGIVAAVAGLPVRPTYGLGLALAGVLVAAFCVRSRGVPGTGLVCAGLLLNALVVAVNAGMPVSADAALRAGVGYLDATAGPLHVPAGGGTTLRLLGDVIPVPLPFRPEAVSVGDVLVAAGLAQLVVTAMLPRRGARRPTGHRTPAPDPD